MSFRKLDTAFFSRRGVAVNNDSGQVTQSPRHILNITRPSTDEFAVTPFSWMILDSTSTSRTGATSPTLSLPTPTSAGPSYLYYRVYADDSPVTLAKPAYSNDSFLGHILASSVTPPHTVANIKHHLCKLEGISVHAATDLFTAMYDESPANDSEYIPIINRDAPGSTPSAPIALVVKASFLEVKPPLKMVRLKALTKRIKPVQTRYLYYRLYTDDGEISPKQPVRSEGVALGRIEADSIVPPHTVISLKRRIAKAEGIHASKPCQLFGNLENESPVEDGPLSIFTGDCPGSTPDWPMALVFPASSESPATLFDLPPEFSEFTKKIKGKQDCNDGRHNPSFIDFRKNEILYTDGRILEMTGGNSGGRKAARRMKVYRAVNEARLSGFVMKDAVDYIG